MWTVVARIDPYYQDRFHPWTLVSERLRDAGFDLKVTGLDDEAVGDVNVVQLEAILERPATWPGLLDRNLIVYERTGCAPISSRPAVRQMVNDPRLRGWIKDILFRDPALYNAPMVGSRLHLAWLPTAEGAIVPATPQAVTLTPEALAKVRSCLPIYWYPRMDPFLGEEPARISGRQVDLFFAGNLDFMWPQVTEHRHRACQAILATRKRAIVCTGNVLKTKRYVDMLRLPKMMVSPYGSGGYSWKDFECMYMGVIVIKPVNDFSMTYGFDVFDGERHVVKCRPDFSDLSQVVEKVLDNQAFYDELAARNRAGILKARDPEMLARDLVAMFTRAVEGQSAPAPAVSPALP